MRSIGRWPAGAASVTFLALAAGCGNGGAGEADGGPSDAPTIIEGGQCTATIQNHPSEGFNHVTCTTPTNYQTSPPSSGNHYQAWAAYQTYATPVPWGHLVHAMEHGAVIVVYNCADGCTDEVARAQAVIDATTDPLCGSARRIILAPDPGLDVRWAAAAWTWTLRAPCFEEPAFRTFIDEHLGHGLEAICSDGTVSFCS